jgi:excisionase family DNA binding protein
MSQLLKIPQAASELSISRSQLYELIGEGALRSVKIGSRGVRIPASEIQRYIAERLTSNRSEAA